MNHTLLSILCSFLSDHKILPDVVARVTDELADMPPAAAIAILIKSRDLVKDLFDPNDLFIYAQSPTLVEYLAVHWSNDFDHSQIHECVTEQLADPETDHELPNLKLKILHELESAVESESEPDEPEHNHEDIKLML